MVETQAQRTLVKSPPELWAELSDPATLGRHLGALSGDIRITRVEPETTVVWEGERATGRVELTPSGWGTKVTLTVKATSALLEAPPAPVVPPPAPGESETPAAAMTHTQSAAAAASAVPDADPTPTADAEAPRAGTAAADLRGWEAAGGVRATADRPAGAARLAVEQEQPAAVSTAEQPATRAPEPVVCDDGAVRGQNGEPPAAAERAVPPRRGFFARLFGRSRPAPADVVPEPAAPDEPDAPAPAPEAEAEAEAETTVAPRAASPAPSAPGAWGRSHEVATATPSAGGASEPIALPATGTGAPDVAPAASGAGEIAAPQPSSAPSIGDEAALVAAEPEAAAATAPAPAALVAAEPQAAAAKAHPPPATTDEPRPDVPAATDDEPIDATPAMDHADRAPGLDRERAGELLVGVLDALGAAHHRPFSRS